jgi:hypothetical protein
VQAKDGEGGVKVAKKWKIENTKWKVAVPAVGAVVKMYL